MPPFDRKPWPPPRFETDDDRLACVIRLPAHPLAKRPTAEVTMEVTMEVTGLLRALEGEMTRSSLQEAMELKNADHFRRAYLLPALAAGLIEMTVPDKPNSRSQRYRLTAKGREWRHAQADRALG